MIAAMVGDITLPPARYDHDPKNVTVYEYSLWQVASECNKPGTVSCAFQIGGRCFVVLPKVGPGGVSLRDRALLTRHEYAHCNGWTKDHER